MKPSCCWSEAYPSAGATTVRNSHSHWLMVFVVGLRAFHQTAIVAIVLAEPCRKNAPRRSEGR